MTVLHILFSGVESRHFVIFIIMIDQNMFQIIVILEFPSA